MAAEKRELDALASDFAALRSANPQASVLSDGIFGRELAGLDAAFWKLCEQSVVNSLRTNKDRLFFNKNERLILDCGYIDDRLVPADPQSFQNDLLREIYTENKTPNINYFSQWLCERFRAYYLFKRFGQKPLAQRKNTFVESLESLKYKKARSALYKELRPLFTNLPGVSAEVADMLPAGRIDAHIEEIAIRHYYTNDTRLLEQRVKMMEVKARLLEKARAFCSTPQELNLFDALTEVDARIWSNFVFALNSGTLKSVMPVTDKGFGEADGEGSEEQSLDFVLSELKLIRSVLKLGSTGAGVTRSYSALVSDQRRMTVEVLAPLIVRVKEADPNIPGTPNVLIAPYWGTGFFEWDRDTVFVPLVSTRSEEESFANAMANYRIMMDNLHDESRLKKAYEAELGGANFRANFIRDYKSWVTGVCKGFKGSMPRENYEFFKRNIGPSPANYFAPRESIMLTTEEHKKILQDSRARAARGEAGPQDHCKLGLIYWKDRRLQDAYDEFRVASRMAPNDARMKFCYGWLALELNKGGLGLTAMKEISAMAPNSIWHVYAMEKLGTGNTKS